LDRLCRIALDSGSPLRGVRNDSSVLVKLPVRDPVIHADRQRVLMFRLDHRIRQRRTARNARGTLPSGDDEMREGFSGLAKMQTSS
jgi:hypothetical protein